MKIDEMQAGREMDKIIAKEVMGFELTGDGYIRLFDAETHKPSGYVKSIPNYSTDIGAERATDWVEERLYAIVDTRYRMQRATIFTSNLSEKQMQGQLGGRIVSRIYEMTEQVPVIGPDHRRKMA